MQQAEWREYLKTKMSHVTAHQTAWVHFQLVTSQATREHMDLRVFSSKQPDALKRAIHQVFERVSGLDKTSPIQLACVRRCVIKKHNRYREPFRKTFTVEHLIQFTECHKLKQLRRGDSTHISSHNEERMYGSVEGLNFSQGRKDTIPAQEASTSENGTEFGKLSLEMKKLLRSVDLEWLGRRFELNGIVTQDQMFMLRDSTELLNRIIGILRHPMEGDESDGKALTPFQEEEFLYDNAQSLRHKVAWARHTSSSGPFRPWIETTVPTQPSVLLKFQTTLQNIFKIKTFNEWTSFRTMLGKLCRRYLDIDKTGIAQYKRIKEVQRGLAARFPTVIMEDGLHAPVLRQYIVKFHDRQRHMQMQFVGGSLNQSGNEAKSDDDYAQESESDIASGSEEEVENYLLEVEPEIVDQHHGAYDRKGLEVFPYPKRAFAAKNSIFRFNLGELAFGTSFATPQDFYIRKSPLQQHTKRSTATNLDDTMAEVKHLLRGTGLLWMVGRFQKVGLVTKEGLIRTGRNKTLLERMIGIRLRTPVAGDDSKGRVLTAFEQNALAVAFLNFVKEKKGHA
ncbi:hypothetical protein FA15DRAFT_697074 [Coprinopsis marcescibilis]|uniref:Uncharacterized protein n=1 Tax=Coprinopsis marcescibilis TaxID=230819 RepID=A0A5C3KIU2_COPMA|nr:hypothetical protein FA15DRAFT_697074 [Coprinopsis marcescibilis]